MQVFCCATDHAKIILSSLLNLLQTFFSLSLNKDETLYSTPKHTQSEKYLSEQVRIIISVFSGANVSLTRGRGGGTYSDSREATGHLYCAVENKQISANCRTENKEKEFTQ